MLTNRKEYIHKRLKYCSVRSCKYFLGTDDSRTTIFRAPKENDPLRKVWEKCLTSNPSKNIPVFSTLCHLHFRQEDLQFTMDFGKLRCRLKQGVLPLPIEMTRKDVKTELDDQPIPDIKFVDIKQIKVSSNDTNVVNIKSEPMDTNEPQTIFAEIQAEPNGCTKCIELQTQYKKQLQQQQLTAKTKLEELSTEIRTLRLENSRLQCLLGLSTHNETLEPKMKEEILTSKIDVENIVEPKGAINVDDMFEPIVNIDTVQLKETITDINMQNKPTAQTSNGVQTVQIVQSVQRIPSSSTNGSYDKTQKFFKCGICHETFDTGKELNTHIKGHTALTKERVDVNVENQNSFECYLCKYKSKTKEELHEHMAQHNRKKKCEICNTLLTFEELKSHLCGREKSIKCEYCKKRFNVMNKLVKHLKITHSTTKRLYRCDKCSKFFLMAILKDLHQSSHVNVPKPFMCDKCSKRFTKKVHLDSHRKSHNLERTFLCDECGKGYLTTQSLEQHKLYHSEPKIQCPDCPQKFYQATHLRRHSDLHRNHKYVCEICGNELQSLNGYHTHIKRHRRTDADRKFACERCPLKFFTSKSLKAHQFVHTAQKSFHCNFCEQSYKYRGDLNKHLKTHMNGKIHECSKCPMRFQYPRELQKHSFEHYKEEKTNDLKAENME